MSGPSSRASAAGAVIFLERVSPALEQVDSSSGAIGSAVNRTIDELTAIIASAPVDRATREAWLERLWSAHEKDEVPIHRAARRPLGRSLRLGGAGLRVGRSPAREHASRD